MLIYPLVLSHDRSKVLLNKGINSSGETIYSLACHYVDYIPAEAGFDFIIERAADFLDLDCTFERLIYLGNDFIGATVRLNKQPNPKSSWKFFKSNDALKLCRDLRHFDACKAILAEQNGYSYPLDPMEKLNFTE